MKRLIISLVMTCGISIASIGQPLPQYESNWQVKIYGGGNFSLSSPIFPGSHYLENLISYKDNSGVAGISASWFFSRRWGIEAGYQNMINNQGWRDAENRFLEGLADRYSDEYHIGRVYLSEPSSDRIHLGVVFRIEKGRLLCYPKLRLGLYSIGIASGGTTMEEKPSGSTGELTYGGSKGRANFLSFSPAVTIGCKISSRFYLTLDLEADYFRPRFTVSSTLAGDWRTQQTRIQLTGNVFRMSVSGGVTVVLGKRKEFRSRTLRIPQGS